MSSSNSSSLLAIVAYQPMPPFIFALAIGFPSAILYVIEVLLILVGPKKNVFDSSFFKLLVVRAIWSLLGYLAGFWFERFGRLGIFHSVYLNMAPFWLSLMYFLVVHSFHVDLWATMALLLNRLTAIIYPIKYKQIWQRAIYFSIALIMLLPLALTWFIFTLHSFVHVQVDGSFTIDSWERMESNEKDPTVLYCGYSSAIFTVVCLGLNLACLIAYRRRIRQQQNSSQAIAAVQNDSSKMEMKITMYAIVTFFSQLFLSAYEFLMFFPEYIISDPELDQLVFLSLFNQFSWVNDLCTITVPAWLLLWASDPIRESITKIMRKLKIHGTKVGGEQEAAHLPSNGPKVAWTQN